MSINHTAIISISYTKKVPQEIMAVYTYKFSNTTENSKYSLKAGKMLQFLGPFIKLQKVITPSSCWSVPLHSTTWLPLNRFS
jgi:hypothetical protein